MSNLRSESIQKNDDYLNLRNIILFQEMFYFLIIFSSPIAHSSKFSIHSTYELPSFAFSENGKAEFTIKSRKNNQNVAFYVLLLNEKQRNMIRKMNSQEARQIIINNEINTKLTIAIDKNHSSNNITITESGIYFPYIVNKDEAFNVKEIQIDYTFKNEKGFVDEREQGSFKLYLKLSVIYAIISLIWLMNGIKYMQFRVIIHTGFMLLPIIKLIYCMLEYQHWKTLENEGISILDDWITFFSFMFSLVTSLCICSSIGGICILRERMRLREIRNIILLSLSLAVGYSMLLKTDSITMFWTSLAIAFFSSLFIAKQSIIYMIIISRSCFSSGKHSVITQKYNLYSQFIKTDFIILIILFVVWWTLCISEIYYPYTERAAEIMYLIFNIIQMRFFMFRESYIGIPSTNKQTTRMESYIIRDPSHSFNAFLLICN